MISCKPEKLVSTAAIARAWLCCHVTGMVLRLLKPAKRSSCETCYQIYELIYLGEPFPNA